MRRGWTAATAFGYLCTPDRPRRGGLRPWDAERAGSRCRSASIVARSSSMRTRWMLAGVALAAALFAGLRWVTWPSPSPPAALAPALQPAASAELSGAGDVPPAAARAGLPVGEGRAPLARAELEAGGANDVRIAGRVLDATRRPVAGARVMLEVDGALVREALSDATGRFERTLTLPSPALPVGVCASDAQGHAARLTLTAARLEAALTTSLGEGEARVELEPLVLLPAHALHVSVRDGAGAAAGARLTVELGHTRSQSFEARTDERGELTLAHLPRGPLYLEARAAQGTTGGVAGASAFVPEDARLVLVLEPLGAGEVRVVDAQTGAPVAGAEVALDVWLRMPGAFPGEARRGFLGEAVQSRPVEVVRTDDAGRARFEGLFRGGRYRASVRAEGYPAFPRPPATGPVLRVGGEPVTIELTPLARRRVRWPIVAGELPVPADGTPIELHVPPEVLGIGQAPPPAQAARMEGTFLVADGIGGSQLYLARDPRGALARLWVEGGAELGREASFRRARRIVLGVSERDGRPVVGAGVAARNQGNILQGPVVTTDSEGRAVLEDLYGGLLGLHVDRTGGSRGPNVAQVDLEPGDAELGVALPGRAHATLAVRIEGRPQLPPTLGLHAGDGVRVRVLAEDPEAAVLELELDGIDPGGSCALHLQAPGLRGTAARLEIPLDGSPARGEVTLERLGALHVRVAGEVPEAFEVVPERFDGDAGTWKVPVGHMASSGLRYPNGPAGGFAFGELEPGRWRVLDRASGTASSEAELAPGGAVEVTLVLAGTAWVAGRVELADPAELARTLVRVEGLEEDTTSRRWLPGHQPPAGTWPKEGEFRIRVPKDREVTLVPWHPWLVPAADGTARVRGGAEGLVLRLVEGDGLVLLAPQLAEQRRVDALRVARYPADVGAPLPDEPLEWHHAPLLEGRARCAVPAGTWTFWIDPGAAFEPLLVRGLDVAGLVERALEFRTGSALRVRVRVPEGQDPPRLYVSARSEGGPEHLRDLNSRGEAEVVLAGLAAGRYAVTYGEIMGARSTRREVLEFDGRTDRLLELDLR